MLWLCRFVVLFVVILFDVWYWQIVVVCLGLVGYGSWFAVCYIVLTNRSCLDWMLVLFSLAG